MFDVAFGDDVDNPIGGPIEVAERESFIAASLLAARARGLGILNTPEIVGGLAEGLGFSDEVLYNYQGDAAEIAAVGSCIQLLCGASPLVQDQPERFAKDKIVASLDCLKVRSIDQGSFHRLDRGICTCIHGFECSSRNRIWKRSKS